MAGLVLPEMGVLVWVTSCVFQTCRSKQPRAVSAWPPAKGRHAERAKEAYEGNKGVDVPRVGKVSS
jgi:hypothetical protein